MDPGVIGGERDRRQVAARLARRAGQPRTDPPDADLVRRVVRRHRFAMAGVVAGLVLLVAIAVPASVFQLTGGARWAARRLGPARAVAP